MDAGVGGEDHLAHEASYSFESDLDEFTDVDLSKFIPAKVRSKGLHKEFRGARHVGGERPAAGPALAAARAARRGRGEGDTTSTTTAAAAAAAGANTGGANDVNPGVAAVGTATAVDTLEEFPLSEVMDPAVELMYG